MITIPLRILLVEDFKVDADLTKRQIAKIVEKPEVEVVDNLADCKQKLQNFVPDVIISDYNLPTCNGLDVLQLSKSIDETIPFIFLTGTIDDDELAANTILAGASGFILKKHMKHLDEKLRPLLKKVVFNMIEKEELREKIRKNKIAVNQIYQYLDNMNADNEEQRSNIDQIRKNIEQIEYKQED
ncbi:response regulator [Mesonia aquimarina]|uniref:response regulator n=1 Tax=Mesonia aquimarina TaxID=1504967 RepID=UPI000EF5E634|nr:response regulator [Mesonia aquimarina]